MKRHLPQSHNIEMFLMVSKTKASRLQRCLASPCRHYLLVLAEEDDRKGLRGLSEPVVLSRSSSRAPVVPLRISEPAGTRPPTVGKHVLGPSRFIGPPMESSRPFHHRAVLLRPGSSALPSRCRAVTAPPPRASCCLSIAVEDSRHWPAFDITWPQAI